MRCMPLSDQRLFLFGYVKLTRLGQVGIIGILSWKGAGVIDRQETNYFLSFGCRDRI